MQEQGTRNKRQGGFTLIEMIVSAGLFVFVVSAATGVYLATTRLDTKSRAERAVLQNARFIMDFLSKEIRYGAINYSSINDSKHLSLINQSNERVHVYWVNNPPTDPEYLKLMLDKSIGRVPLNSDEVEITKLIFYLSPTTDPFNLANDVHIQPHVTVVLEISTKDMSQGRGAKINLQSTFTSREYPLR